MKTAHTGMKITDAELTALVGGTKGDIVGV